MTTQARHPSPIMQAHLNRTIHCGHHGTLIEVRGDGCSYPTFTMDCEQRCPTHDPTLPKHR